MSYEFKSAATLFLDEHPELREAMRASRTFDAIKVQTLMEVDGESLYVVRGDTLGEEDDLYVDSLAKGSSPEGEGRLYGLARELFQELDDPLKDLVVKHLNPRRALPSR